MNNENWKIVLEDTLLEIKLKRLQESTPGNPPLLI